MSDNDNVIPPPTEGDLGFTDIEAAFNMRDWLQSALIAKGATMTGSGMGCGGADLWFSIDGCEFFVSIKQVLRWRA